MQPRPFSRALAALVLPWIAACSTPPESPSRTAANKSITTMSPTAPKEPVATQPQIAGDVGTANAPTPETANAPAESTAVQPQNPGATPDWNTLFGNPIDPVAPQDRATQAEREQENKAWDNAFGKLDRDQFATLFAAKISDQKAEKERENSLDGFNFGTGIGATFDLHSGTRVSSASLVSDGNNGQIVRVEAESDTQVGLMLETHYFWTTKDKLVGYGPFFAIRTSDTEPVDEAGLGFMVGLRRSKEDTNSFNLGIGVMVDPDARVLADGFAPNLAPPAGSDSIGYREEERFSLAILFSYTF